MQQIAVPEFLLMFYFFVCCYVVSVLLLFNLLFLPPLYVSEIILTVAILISTNAYFAFYVKIMGGESFIWLPITYVSEVAFAIALGVVYVRRRR